MEGKQRWIPIESNPEVIQKYLAALGFPIGQYRVSDILSCEPWAVEMVPGIICAILLLYPINPYTTSSTIAPSQSPSIYHMKQLISNACGTIGLIHMAANLRENEIMSSQVPLTGFFHRFLRSTLEMTSEARGRELIENQELFEEIKTAHSHAASQGQTQARERVNTHFVAFVAKDGCVVELDGRKDGPINHGRYSSPESFSTEALQVINREFISKDPSSLEFALLGLYFALD